VYRPAKPRAYLDPSGFMNHFGGGASGYSAGYADGYGTGSNPSYHHTSGYRRRDGTWVDGYDATNPNGTQGDNFSALGNRYPDGRIGRRRVRY
jgi:hypothetical protein